MARIVGQTWIVDRGDGLVAREESRHRLGVGGVPFHADRQGLDAAEGEPTVKRARHRAEGVLCELQFLVKVAAVHDERPAQEVRVAPEVLRRAVDDQVDAEAQRVLQRRRREGVVAHADRVVGLRDHGELPQVGDLHEGVRGRLHPQHLRLRAKGILDVDEVPQVHEGGLDAVPAHDPREDPVDAAVAVIRHYGVIAFLEEGEGRRDRAHAAREAKGLLALLEGREALLERIAGRVVAPPVDVVVLDLLGVRRGHVDRRRDRAGPRVRFLSSVDGLRRKVHRDRRRRSRPPGVKALPQARPARYSITSMRVMIPSSRFSLPTMTAGLPRIKSL